MIPNLHVMGFCMGNKRDPLAEICRRKPAADQAEGLNQGESNQADDNVKLLIRQLRRLTGD